MKENHKCRASFINDFLKRLLHVSVSQHDFDLQEPKKPREIIFIVTPVFSFLSSETKTGNRTKEKKRSQNRTEVSISITGNRRGSSSFRMCNERMKERERKKERESESEREAGARA